MNQFDFSRAMPTLNLRTGMLGERDWGLSQRKILGTRLVYTDPCEIGPPVMYLMIYDDDGHHTKEFHNSQILRYEAGFYIAIQLCQLPLRIGSVAILLVDNTTTKVTLTFRKQSGLRINHLWSFLSLCHSLRATEYCLLTFLCVDK